MRLWCWLAALVVVGIPLMAGRSEAAGDAGRGAQVFRSCAACHSLRPGLNRTGPSLSGVWDRKAGSLRSFARYSAALRQSNMIWGQASLDAWLQGPSRLVPGNSMTFPGIPDQADREDVIAFLKAVSMSERGGPPVTIPSAYTALPLDLKGLPPAQRVTAIRACNDSYFVMTDDKQTRAFWDQSLRFETDASSFGPRLGAPVILPAGMFGDRASIIFGNAKEIGSFVMTDCGALDEPGRVPSP
jgi:cytochrome c